MYEPRPAKCGSCHQHLHCKCGATPNFEYVGGLFRQVIIRCPKCGTQTWDSSDTEDRVAYSWNNGPLAKPKVENETP